MRKAITRVRVDVYALWEAVAVRLARTGVDQNGLSDQTGITRQTISWLHQAARKGNTRYQPGAAVFMTLCWWLDADPREFQTVVLTKGRS